MSTTIEQLIRRRVQAQRKMTRSITAAFLTMLTCQGFGITVTIEASYQPTCIYANGYISASVDGGIPPYTFAWSNGATDQYLSDVPAGTYSVTVTDANLETATDTYVLQSGNVSGYARFVPGCVDPSLGQWPEYRLFVHALSPFPAIGPMGTAPITMGNGYSATMLDFADGASFAYIEPPGQIWPDAGEYFIIPFTDGQGCQGEIEVVVPEDPAFPNLQLLDIIGSCSGGNNGGFELFVPRAPNGWTSRLEVFRDGQFLGLLSMDTGSEANLFGQVDRTVVEHDFPAGDYQILSSSYSSDPNIQEVMDNYFAAQSSTCKDTLSFTIPDLGYTCGTIEGYAFMDDNQNCVRNGAEPRFPQSVLEIQPGNIFTMTDQNGDYWAQLPYGSYTLEQQSPLVVEHCSGAPIPFDIDLATPEVTELLPDTGLVDRDVSITIGSGPARPGFQMEYVVWVRNLTPGSVSNVAVTLTFDPTLGYLSTLPVAADVVGNVVTWNLGSIPSFGYKNARVTLQVPPDVNLIGTDLLTTASVSVTQAEPDVTNNTFNNILTVTGSYDPNDKKVFTESNNDGLFVIEEDEWLDYTIRFQNTGTDTAFFVVITDTLPNTVDPATFIAGAASHGYRVGMSGQGIVRFSFPNILLPDSNVNELGSHGFVTFRIKPYQPVVPGTVIENIANIFFDYNPPIITEPSILVAESSTGLMESDPHELLVMPNPTEGRLMVRRSGDDLRPGMLFVRGIDGRSMLEQRILGASAMLNMEALAAGVYMLEHRTDNGSSTTVRIVKQ